MPFSSLPPVPVFENTVGIYGAQQEAKADREGDVEEHVTCSNDCISHLP